MRFSMGLAVMIGAAAAVGAQEGPSVWLETLDLTAMRQDWAEPQANRSVNGGTLSIGGQEFARGIGTHAFSLLAVALSGEAERFEAWIGVDDEVGTQGSVRYQVWLDREVAWESDVLRGGDAPVPVAIDLRGAREVLFMVNEGPDLNVCDHCNWADARIIMRAGSTLTPQSVSMNLPPRPIAPLEETDVPAIHGPRLTGATPGRPFLFRIPATGAPPLAFEAEGLPRGLTLDGATGIIAGAVADEGVSDVTLRVRNEAGVGERVLRLVARPGSLALTPPMGWNSWNVWGPAIDAEKVRAAADAMDSSGLAAHGYQYVVIDDCWEGPRNASGEITSNEQFPDMWALSDHIHSLGLKFGIYSSPGPTTCQGFPGSYQHEGQDAATWASWGVDYLKYDWCSASSVYNRDDPEHLRWPYRQMHGALEAAGRDVVFSLCQYGQGDVWTWGPEVGGNLWRTGGDIADSWSSMAGIGFGQAGLESYAGPGHWNDPDMLVVGVVGWGQSLSPTHLTQDEQVTHITLWSLLAAPLMLGCDLTQLDDFTLALLCNDEVIDVDQDPLGRQAARVEQGDLTEVWARPLWDGTIAAGLFNRGPFPAEVTARWSAIGAEGRQAVRDLWLRRDVGEFDGGYSVEVPPRGAVMIRVGTPGATHWPDGE